MKLIAAIIQPHKLDEVKSALVNLGDIAMTSTEVSGFGRQKGHLEIYRGTEYVIDFVRKIKLEIVCRDDQYDSIIHVISETAISGKLEMERSLSRMSPMPTEFVLQKLAIELCNEVGQVSLDFL
jgi:nitrogen regulatory protein PII